MKRKLIVTTIILCFAITGFAQQLPWGACGIVNTYDSAGNRLKRVYFCNNGDPYPQKNQQEIMEFEMVDALYPNPTTGKFSITFSKPLQNASILVTDVNGKPIRQFKANGSKVDFDLSAVAAGVYFVRIQEENKIISKKVIKQ
jgi:hypothetical protein